MELIIENLFSGKYKTFLFDCDGVIMDSNRIKTEAFRQLALPFGEDAAEKLVRHHVENGGISRYSKIQYLISEILGRDCTEEFYQDLLQRYSEGVWNSLLKSPLTNGLENFLERFSETRKGVVSGADEEELNTLFRDRKLAPHFQLGIHGSPRNKMQVLEDLSNTENLERPALFFGDAPYDYQTAKAFECDFIFLFGYTELSDWRLFVEERQILSFRNFTELLSNF